MPRAPQEPAPVFHFAPRNETQKRVWESFTSYDLLFLLGPAGSGKTQAAMACAVSEVVKEKKKHVLYLRAPVEAGPTIGYLSGDKDEKIAPYRVPAEHVLKKLAFNLGRNVLQFDVPQFQQGVTYDDTAVVLDEAQQCDLAQLKLILTRMGKNCRIFVAGDEQQSFIKGSLHPSVCDLTHAASRLAHLPNVGTFHFKESEVVRHPLVREVLRLL